MGSFAFASLPSPPNLSLAPFSQLESVKERTMCKECGRKRMYFCYDCLLYVGDVASMVPKVELPFRLDIIKHWHELSSKSTAIHALLLCPEKTYLFNKFEEVPNYGLESTNDKDNVVVLFPSKHSVSIGQFVALNGPIRRMVVLDSTWNTVGQLRNLPQLAKLPWVHLRQYKTDYWRPQNGLSSDHLATIEAIYYACWECREAERDWNKKRRKDNEGAMRGREENDLDDCNLDNLLFWFYFFRRMVPAEKILAK